MSLAFSSKLPRARVRLAEYVHGELSEMLETMEERFVAGRRQPAIEEQVCRGEHRRALGVVLNLEVGLIAEPNRPHAQISRKLLHDSLRQRPATVDSAGAVRLHYSRRR